jgi:hypothetical protein
VAVLIHPVFGVFDRAADPGYVLSEMEKHHVGERELELGRPGFSQARKNDAKLVAQRNSTGDIERSNCSAADSEQGKHLLDNCWTFVCK